VYFVFELHDNTWYLEVFRGDVVYGDAIDDRFIMKFCYVALCKFGYFTQL